MVPKKKKVVVVDLTDSPVKAPKKPKKKKKLEPMRAGEKKELHKISVGNILSESEKKKGGEDKARKELKKAGFSEKEIDEILGGGGLSTAAKVRKLLKASKRRGKRRTKKQLLQDVLDLWKLLGSKKSFLKELEIFSKEELNFGWWCVSETFYFGPPHNPVFFKLVRQVS